MQLIFVPWMNVKENRKHERSLQSPKWDSEVKFYELACLEILEDRIF